MPSGVGGTLAWLKSKKGEIRRMAWTNPKTWVDQELVTATDLNAQLSGNLLALKNPPSAHYEANEASDYTTTSPTFVDVDETVGKFNLTITPSGSEVMVGFHGAVEGANTRPTFDVDVDGVKVGGDHGITVLFASLETIPVSFVRLVTGLTPNQAHTFKLQWRSPGGSATLYAGAGTAGKDVHPQFWVREVS